MALLPGQKIIIDKDWLKKPKVPGIVQTEKERCIQNCEDTYQAEIAEGAAPDKAGKRRTECLEHCESLTDGDGGGGGGGNGEGCEGGYPLSESPYSSDQGGAGLDDEWGKWGWKRAGSWQAHWYVHEKYGLHPKDVVIKHCQEGIEPTVNSGGKVCGKGYSRKSVNGVTWCCPAAAEGTTGATTGTLGEFKWSPELLALIGQMRGRLSDVLNRPPGLTEEERQKIKNFATQGVYRSERGRNQEVIDALSRQGLLGSGLMTDELGRVRRESREQATGIEQSLGINEIDRRFQELMGSTDMARNLLGTLMTTEQMPEMLSGARRGESREMMAMVIQYMMMMMGGQQNNTYWQSIFNSMDGNQSGSIWDIVPWLGPLIGGNLGQGETPALDYPNPWG